MDMDVTVVASSETLQSGLRHFMAVMAAMVEK
jgi:hypothetical protein